MSTSSKEVEEVLQYLKILSKLRHNERLATCLSNSLVGIEAKSVFQGLRRYLRGESRRDNLEVVESILHRSFQVLHNLIHNEDHLTADFFVREMYTALEGFSNLLTTYEEDGVTRAKIEVILATAYRRLEKARSMREKDVGNGCAFPPRQG